MISGDKFKCWKDAVFHNRWRDFIQEWPCQTSFEGRTSGWSFAASLSETSNCVGSLKSITRPVLWTTYWLRRLNCDQRMSLVSGRSMNGGWFTAWFRGHVLWLSWTTIPWDLWMSLNNEN
jgi:hypothetical protein